MEGDRMELVTNVQVVADLKECERRTEMREACRQRVEKLENEAKSSRERFDEIVRKWTEDQQRVNPSLRDALQSQVQLCTVIIEDKNKLIDELQQELKAKEDCYHKDLKKQAEEVDLIIEKMEDEIKTQMRIYREETDQIQSVYEQEIEILQMENGKKWEQHMKERHDKELEQLKQRVKNVEEYQAQLQQLRLDEADDNSSFKNKLETEAQIAEPQLQQIKVHHHMKMANRFDSKEWEKRDSTIAKIQQKNKIIRNPKTKCVSQETASREKIKKLFMENKQLKQQIKEIKMGIRHLQDSKRFKEMWLMNELEVKQLVERALDIDWLIHEHIGLAWEWPNAAPLMECPDPINSEKKNQWTAHQASSQLIPTGKAPKLSLELKDASVRHTYMTKTGAKYVAMPTYRKGSAMQSERSTELEKEESTAEQKGKLSVNKGKVSMKTVNKLLELLCNEAGFLRVVEGKIQSLLSPLDRNTQSLIKLCSIFSALGIECEDDMYKLAEFVLRFKQEQREQAEGVSEEQGGCDAMVEEGENTSLTSDLLHPNNVLAALKAFTAQHRRSRSKHRSSVLMGLGGRDHSEDAAYWESMANIISESKLKMWDTLEDSLKKYHAALKKRSKLVTEIGFLKQQNTDLQQLLEHILNCQGMCTMYYLQVKAQLEVLPTEVMQLAPM
ncbi:dynein regulatory complex protein 1-like [Lampris incognitus]|uniref:dynein regulatory complex protein 1-like n=1 Tax=Lampris incognitus TaxID=2546036 RepID=UPI0024B51DD7|nr:dynein regulatory complex protein 1-like [Lampris incognitus]